MSLARETELDVRARYVRLLMMMITMVSPDSGSTKFLYRYLGKCWHLRHCREVHVCLTHLISSQAGPGSASREEWSKKDW